MTARWPTYIAFWSTSDMSHSWNILLECALNLLVFGKDSFHWKVIEFHVKWLRDDRDSIRPNSYCMIIVRGYFSSLHMLPTRCLTSRMFSTRYFSVSPYRAADLPKAHAEALKTFKNSQTFQKISQNPAALSAIQMLSDSMKTSGPLRSTVLQRLWRVISQGLNLEPNRPHSKCWSWLQILNLERHRSVWFKNFRRQVSIWIRRYGARELTLTRINSR